MYSAYMSEEFKAEEKAMISEFEELQWSSDWPETNNILITNSNTQIQNIPQKTLKDCKLIIHSNSGYDNFSFEFVKNAPMPIINGNLIRAQAVSEYSLACLFQHYCLIQDQAQWQQSRTWNRKLLNELNIQLVGFGHIGQTVFKTLTALGCQVSVYDPFSKTLKESSLSNHIDVLILCCGLNKENLHMVDSTFLKKLNSDALIINGARGKLIHEEDLIHFLKNNPHAYAYLDVFEKEPFSLNDKIVSLKNICKTSHIAGCSQTLEKKILDFEKQILKDFLSHHNFAKIYQDSLLQNRLENDVLV